MPPAPGVYTLAMHVSSPCTYLSLVMYSVQHPTASSTRFYYSFRRSESKNRNRAYPSRFPVLSSPFFAEAKFNDMSTQSEGMSGDPASDSTTPRCRGILHRRLGARSTASQSAERMITTANRVSLCPSRRSLTTPGSQRPAPWVMTTLWMMTSPRTEQTKSVRAVEVHRAFGPRLGRKSHQDERSLRRGQGESDQPAKDRVPDLPVSSSRVPL